MLLHDLESIAQALGVNVAELFIPPGVNGGGAGDVEVVGGGVGASIGARSLSPGYFLRPFVGDGLWWIAVYISFLYPHQYMFSIFREITKLKDYPYVDN